MVAKNEDQVELVRLASRDLRVVGARTLNPGDSSTLILAPGITGRRAALHFFASQFVKGGGALETTAFYFEIDGGQADVDDHFWFAHQATQLAIVDEAMPPIVFPCAVEPFYVSVIDSGLTITYDIGATLPANFFISMAWTVCYEPQNERNPLV